jgi:hypothetical protein
MNCNPSCGSILLKNIDEKIFKNLFEKDINILEVS